MVVFPKSCFAFTGSGDAGAPSVMVVLPEEFGRVRSGQWDTRSVEVVSAGGLGCLLLGVLIRRGCFAPGWLIRLFDSSILGKPTGRGGGKGLFTGQVRRWR